MEAFAFLLFAAGCIIAIHTIEVLMARRRAARQYRHARPMSNREFRDTYYLGIEEQW